MNSLGPPKAAGGSANAAHEIAELLPEYRRQPVLQPALVCVVAWEREAVRLFREFWRTGNQNHLRAFFTHVVAMRAFVERRA